MTDDVTGSGRPESSPAAADDQASVRIRVRSLWTAELGESGFNDTDDVLDLGATSLQVARVLAALRKEYAVRISLAAFLDHPSVHGLASSVVERRAGAAPQ